MKFFNATIVYTNTAHDDDPRCKQSPCPNVNEYNDITMLRSKIIDLQYFLYRPDYILVEFEGYIYDCTDINRLRQVKQYLVKEYAKELKYEF